MLHTTKPHIVTYGVDGDAMTLVFYPDTGCLRFAMRGIATSAGRRIPGSRRFPHGEVRTVALRSYSVSSGVVRSTRRAA